MSSNIIQSRKRSQGKLGLAGNSGEQPRSWKQSLFWQSGEKKGKTMFAKINLVGTATEKEVNGSRKVGRQVQPTTGDPGVILTAHPDRKDQTSCIHTPRIIINYHNGLFQLEHKTGE